MYVCMYVCMLLSRANNCFDRGSRIIEYSCILIVFGPGSHPRECGSVIVGDTIQWRSLARELENVACPLRVVVASWLNNSRKRVLMRGFFEQIGAFCPQRTASCPDPSFFLPSPPGHCPHTHPARQENGPPLNSVKTTFEPSWATKPSNH